MRQWCRPGRCCRRPTGLATFGQVMTFLLDDQVCWQVYIPRGFLHGFQALTGVTDIVYRIDEFHARTVMSQSDTMILTSRSRGRRQQRS